MRTNKDKKKGASTTTVRSGSRSVLKSCSRVVEKSCCHPARCSVALISQYPDCPIYGQSCILPSIFIIPALNTPPKLIIKTSTSKEAERISPLGAEILIGY